MDEDKWLEERRTGIGGSDAPVVLGVSPFKSRLQLWREKIGAEPDEQPSAAMLRGKYLEPVIADMYSAATNRKLRRVNEIKRHPQIGYLIASIDRHIFAAPESDGPGVLEIKCPGLSVWGKIQREGLPNYYMIQLQHYMGVTGWRWGSIAVFQAERWQLLHFDVKRDEELIALIFARSAEFWRYVETRQEPPEEPASKLDLPTVGGEIVKCDDSEWAEAVNHLREAHELRTVAESLYESAANRVKSIMERVDAGVVEGCGARVYWTPQAGRVTFDRKRMERDYPDLPWAKYERVGKPFKTFRPYFLNNKVEE